MRSTTFVSSRAARVVLAALILGCATMVADAQTVQNNGRGTNNGFFYSLFTSSGTSTMTFPENAQFPGIILHVLLIGDVSAMKRDQARLVPCADEWQQMHTGMSKIDVHHIGTTPAENGNEHLIFAAINERRAAFDELHPPVAQ